VAGDFEQHKETTTGRGRRTRTTLELAGRNYKQ
jgi:hypothetical protein